MVKSILHRILEDFDLGDDPRIKTMMDISNKRKDRNVLEVMRKYLELREFGLSQDSSVRVMERYYNDLYGLTMPHMDENKIHQTADGYYSTRGGKRIPPIVAYNIFRERGWGARTSFNIIRADPATRKKIKKSEVK
jgi:hypothetical protein